MNIVTPEIGLLIIGVVIAVGVALVLKDRVRNSNAPIVVKSSPLQ